MKVTGQKRGDNWGRLVYCYKRLEKTEELYITENRVVVVT